MASWWFGGSRGHARRRRYLLIQQVNAAVATLNRG